MPPSTLHAPIELTHGPVTITFTWAGDRWSHRVAVRGEPAGREAGRVWESVEGSTPDGDDRWPASPVLVELSRIQTPRGPALLGVGLAGRSHFSACIGPDPQHADRMLFEIACRCSEPPAWLGSTYRGPSGQTVVAPPLAGLTLPSTIQWGYAFSSRGLELPACDRSHDRSDS